MIEIYDESKGDVIPMYKKNAQTREQFIKDEIMKKVGYDPKKEQQTEKVFNGRSFRDKPKGPGLLEVMSMNRHSRRAIGKMNGGIVIPGRNKPIINKN